MRRCDHCGELIIWDAENERWINADPTPGRRCNSIDGHYSDDDIHELRAEVLVLRAVIAELTDELAECRQAGDAALREHLYGTGILRRPESGTDQGAG